MCPTTSEREYPCGADLVQNENARLVREAGILIFIIDEIAQYARISSSTLWNRADHAGVEKVMCSTAARRHLGINWRTLEGGIGVIAVNRY
jgi:hypothetical protein